MERPSGASASSSSSRRATGGHTILGCRHVAHASQSSRTDGGDLNPPSPADVGHGGAGGSPARSQPPPAAVLAPTTTTAPAPLSSLPWSPFLLMCSTPTPRRRWIGGYSRPVPGAPLFASSNTLTAPLGAMFALAWCTARPGRMRLGTMSWGRLTPRPLGPQTRRGNFRQHLIDNKPEVSAATPSSDLDEFVDNLDEMLLPDLTREIEKLSIFDATPTRAAPGFPGSDWTPSGEQRDRFPFSLRNTTTVYQEAMESEFYSALEKDLDELLELGDKDATACREAPIFDDYDSESDPEAELGGQGLVITSTPEGRFMYWTGMKPSELLEGDEILVAHLDSLPFQDGRPLGETTPSGTVLVDYSSDDPSTHRHVFMAESDEYSDRHRNERPKQISEDGTLHMPPTSPLRTMRPAGYATGNVPNAEGTPTNGACGFDATSTLSSTLLPPTLPGSHGSQGSRPATHAPHLEGSVRNCRRSELEKLPTGDLHDKINMGRDARSIINNRRKECVGAEGNTTRDDNDRFPAFSSRFDNYKYPEGFKPIGITKYDGGTNTTKVVYFPMALETAPLTWLESLIKNFIDSWEQLRNVFINNFQGAIARAGTRHDLSLCKQERNELLRLYTRRFFDTRATIANILESNIINCFHNGLTDQALFRDFGCNRPKTVAALRNMMQSWADQEEHERDRFLKCGNDYSKRNNDHHNNRSQRDYLGSSRKRKPDDLVVAINRAPRG
ncbi:putative polyprotein [Panicum miliaceum]|uniref:Polyprotein n=1 Tax=Panicum miliaceum TaxID=4540 RepID=A0A3L6RI54_PANMI|nr:putative polyprotein [Panicum miliaceum]